MKNLTLEKGLLDLGIKTHRQLAEVLGINESKLSVQLSMELTEEQQNEIISKARARLNE